MDGMDRWMRVVKVVEKGNGVRVSRMTKGGGQQGEEEKEERRGKEGREECAQVCMHACMQTCAKKERRAHE